MEEMKLRVVEQDIKEGLLYLLTFRICFKKGGYYNVEGKNIVSDTA